MTRTKVVTPTSIEKREARQRRRVEGKEERIRLSAERELMRSVGQELNGATAMLITLRYLMGGGYWFYGLNGGAINPFFEKLYTFRDFCKWFISVPHEQMAGLGISGFYEATGKVGVAVVTSGPGIGQMFAAVGDMWKDRVPAVIISGNTPTTGGSDAFQGSDVAYEFAKRTKKVFYVTKAEDLPTAFFKAFILAQSGRPGPVIVDVPKDVQLQKTKFVFEPSLEALKADLESIVSGSDSFDTAQLVGLAERIAHAKRPLLYVGHGVKLAKAVDELLEFVEKTGIPVTYTLKGKGAFPDGHPLCIGPLGMHGVAAANYAVDAADLLIVFGGRFDDRVIGDPASFAPNAYIAHFDIAPNGIGPEGPQQRKPQLEVRGNVKNSLRAMNGLVSSSPDLREWYSVIEEWKRQFPLWYEQSQEVIKPQFVLQTLNQLLKAERENVIYVTDVGQHQMWAMQYLDTSNPQGFLTSGGAGNMSYGLSAALAAAVSNQGKKVVLVTGDLSFRMLSNTLELYTALRGEKGIKDLDVKVVVIDNLDREHGIPGGMVDQWIKLNVPKTTHIRGTRNKPPIDQIARGFGVNAWEERKPEGVYNSLALALRLPGPQVVSFRCDPEETVLPWILPGKSVKEMILPPYTSVPLRA